MRYMKENLERLDTVDLYRVHTGDGKIFQEGEDFNGLDFGVGNVTSEECEEINGIGPMRCEAAALRYCDVNS